MTATTFDCHILALEVTGATSSSPRDVSLSLAILSERLVSSESYLAAKKDGEVIFTSMGAGLFVLFPSDRTAPFLCALELWEMLREFPLMSVRMALHSGLVEADAGGAGNREVGGEGIREVKQVLDRAQPGQILVSDEFAESLKEMKDLSGRISAAVGGESTGKRGQIEPQRLVILGAVGSRSEGIAVPLEAALVQDGHEISRDRLGEDGVAWAKAVEPRIRAADAVIVIAPSDGSGSELLQYELDIAVDERRRRGRPHVVPVWLDARPDADSSLAMLGNNLHQAVWSGEQDTDRVIEEVSATLAFGQAETETDRLDTSGKAVAGSSHLYVRRATDQVFEDALNDQQSIVLVKGPRQIGKTTLLGRGIKLVDDNGWRCAATDFQMLGTRQLDSENSFYRVVVTTLCRQLGFDYDFDSEWLDNFAPLFNMDGLMREMLAASDRPLVWFMDEADRLFSAPFASDFFALVRSWHNARATDPMGPWRKLTVVIGYATEVHLFIKDLDRSPFNVGRPIPLPMFTLEDTVDLNERYGRVISKPQDVRSLHSLVGGQPFLTRRAFDLLASGAMTIETLLANADADDGPFGDHLKRILLSVTQMQAVWDALVQSISTPDLTDSDGLHRLIAANILVRKPSGKFELPCELYKRYLARFVQPESGR